ncbi:uncharacterized protein BDZ99DRAFT_519993 [Mytilinidion resinicola]|uniref:Uncharacterized protein n=1 Tax=Mytilinidion resinicola TaxID=574789 RepID=A0A6A6YPF1_9PEZI|nr:uncharacterized protein BDZ99DRAFT_519993 [Mytilinidion resinicola]KAF2809894.1 hypothetical protein BDZ99DRAFT_519993 [Mytilinidion resinicola]
MEGSGGNYKSPSAIMVEYSKLMVEETQITGHHSAIQLRMANRVAHSLADHQVEAFRNQAWTLRDELVRINRLRIALLGAYHSVKYQPYWGPDLTNVDSSNVVFIAEAQVPSASISPSDVTETAKASTTSGRITADSNSVAGPSALAPNDTSVSAFPPPAEGSNKYDISDFGNIVRTSTGAHVELICYKCGENAVGRGQKRALHFLGGVEAFRRHLERIHNERLTPSAVLDQCAARTFSEDDIEALATASANAPANAPIVKKIPCQIAARDEGPRNRLGAPISQADINETAQHVANLDASASENGSHHTSTEVPDTRRPSAQRSRQSVSDLVGGGGPQNGIEASIGRVNVGVMMNGNINLTHPASFTLSMSVLHNTGRHLPGFLALQAKVAARKSSGAGVATASSQQAVAPVAQASLAISEQAHSAQHNAGRKRGELPGFLALRAKYAARISSGAGVATASSQQAVAPNAQASPAIPVPSKWTHYYRRDNFGEPDDEYDG